MRQRAPRAWAPAQVVPTKSAQEFPGQHSISVACKREIASARAQTDSALAQYEQSVLRALEETENALVTHARTRDEWMHAADAAQQSARAASLARTRYEDGAEDFLDGTGR